MTARPHQHESEGGSALVKWLRRLRTSLWTALTIVVVLAAVLVGVAQLLLPYSDRYKPELENWLTEVLAEPVTVDEFAGDWVAFGPRLSLTGLQLDRSRTRVANAELHIKPLNYLWPGRSPYRFNLEGLELSLVRQPDGRWQFRPDDPEMSSGEGQAGLTEGLERLASVGELRISNSLINLGGGVDDGDTSTIEAQSFLLKQGRLQATDDEIAITLELAADAAAEGMLELTALFDRRGDQARLRQAYLKAETLSLADWQPLQWLPANKLASLQLAGQVSAEVWLEDSADSARQVVGRINARGLEARPIDSQPDITAVAVDELNSEFQIQLDDEGWSLQLGESGLRQPGFQAPLDLSGWVLQQVSGRWQLRADSIELERLNPSWALLHAMAGSDSGRWPQQTAGQLEALELAWRSSGELLLARGRVTDLGFGFIDGSNWVSGLQVDLDYSAPSGAIRLSGEQVVLGLETAFSKPLNLGRVNCPLLLRSGGILETTECQFQAPAGSVSVRGLIQLNSARPYVDLAADIQRLDAVELRPFVPDRVLSDELSNWLLQAVPEGLGKQGRLLLTGDLDQWPFREGDGVISLRLPVHDVSFSFARDWPEMTAVEGVLSIDNQMLGVADARGRIGGLQLDAASARVADLASPLVVVDGSGQAGLEQIAAFIQEAPMLTELDKLLPRFEFGGEAAIELALELPLRKPQDKLAISGNAELLAGRLTDTESGYQALDINGKLGFTESQLSGTDIEFKLPADTPVARDAPPTFNAQIDFQSQPAFKLGLELGGHSTLQALVPPVLTNRYPELADSLLQPVSGSSDWQLQWQLDRVQGEGKPALNSDLTLSSTLQGLTLEYPQPVSKPADSRWPLQAGLNGLLGGAQQLQVRLDDQLQLQSILPLTSGSQASLALAWGADLPATTSAGTWSAIVSADVVEASDWWALLDPIAGGSEPPGQRPALRMQALDVSAGQFVWGGTVLSDQQLLWTPQSQASGGSQQPGWMIELDGDISGRVRLPGSSEIDDIYIDLDRLHWPRGEASDDPADVDPGRLPALHVTARDVRYGELALDQLQFDGVPVDQGMRFDRITAGSQTLDIRASGRWLMQAGTATSEVDFYLTTEDLGSVLADLDLGAQVEIGQAIVDLSGAWEGAPSKFSLARLNGELLLDIGQGRLVSAEPGAGRLLGLVSLQNLPRRLTLDFSDVFEQGFQFDRAAGAFTLDDGTASTENFTIESAAATVLVSGETNLLAQTWDQELTILPGVGNTLPVLGAIAGGPAGAAAGLALQGLLQGRMSEALATRYAITGPWDSPQVETLASPNTTTGGGGRNSRPGR